MLEPEPAIALSREAALAKEHGHARRTQQRSATCVEHRNPPGARFCDTCGVKLPMQCPRCHAISRGEANFCSNCGIGLGDARRTGAAPPIVPSGPSPDSLSATESQTPARPEPLLPAKQAANERMDGPGSFDPLPLTAGSTKGLFADAPDDEKRLELMVRSSRRRQRRRHTQRAWVLGAVGVSVVIVFLGVAPLPYTHRDAERQPPRVIGADPPGRIATRAQERGVCGDRPKLAGEHRPP